LSKKRHGLDDAERSRWKQAETYNLIKDKLFDLANRVNAVTGEIDDNTKALARDILRAVQDISQRLREFVQTPNTSTLASVRPILIGMSRSEFNKIDFDRLGVNQFVCIVGKNNTCLIAIGQNRYSYTDVLTLAFDKRMY
jgi:hypothetical protein